MPIVQISGEYEWGMKKVGVQGTKAAISLKRGKIERKLVTVRP